MVGDGLPSPISVFRGPFGVTFTLHFTESRFKPIREFPPEISYYEKLQDYSREIFQRNKHA